MYKITKYPDGQINLKLEYLDDKYYEIVQSYEDLFRLKSLSDAALNMFGKTPEIFIPCLFGQLSDRRFCYDESFDLKNICEFINSCNFKRVTVFDPHSDVPEALLNNFRKAVPDDYIISSIQLLEEAFDDITLISPDAGAYKKVAKLANRLNYPLVAASKSRDRIGNINLVVSGDVKGKNCLIVDDICFGGKTFVNLSKKLLTIEASRVFLYASHGFFTNGFDELKQSIVKVFCTNSIQTINNDFVYQFELKPL